MGELSSATISGDWVTAITEKGRKGLPDKTRRIPIPPNLRRVLPYIDLPALRLLRKETVSRNLDNYLKGRHSHDLRHTFVTRCQEVGIRREIVSLWVGHAADTSITSTVYTHLNQNENLQIDEMKKFDYAV